MAYAETTDRVAPRLNEHAVALAGEWRRLGRAALAVALLTAPIMFVLLYERAGWSLVTALIGTLIGVAAFRGLIDVLSHKLIPRPSLYGAETELAEEDVVSRRRLWYWGTWFRRVVRWGIFTAVVLGAISGVRSLSGDPVSLGASWDAFIGGLGTVAQLAAAYAPIISILFLANFLILFGPMLFLGIQQIKGYEPGDADWGVKLADVRGQVEAKEEITRVVALWQSGEEFERAGGKRERGVLFLGPPGTGKTMLSKGIATSFNCPFVSIPGSGFAQTFIGMDAVLVRYLAFKAKRLARKWGGQCIVFIDEIDAVGMRRQSLGGGIGGLGGFIERPATFHDFCFYGPNGALTPDGDLVLETAAWREKLFELRAPEPPAHYPAIVERVRDGIRQFMIPGMGGGMGQMGLQQLLVVMDGIDDPPFTKRVVTRRVNTFLDALYVIPRRARGRSLRLRPPRPRKEEIYFIGACNVPLEALDPALTRPGRMGRHIHFRTPNWEDRRDIFELYLGKVDHEPDLDTDRRRDELARITNGYSPAMIDQVCSMALTYAHSVGRTAFGWGDIVEAMTTVEAGVAIGQPYTQKEEKATAIHEAGHAVCSHLYADNHLSTRLSIRKRGSSGGHHQAMEKEERFAHWRSEEVANLIWTLGAMAAEHVFYRENTTGVGGDVHSATARAARMVGSHAMAPEAIDLADRITDPVRCEAEERRVQERYEKIGFQLMQRSGGGGPFTADPIAAVLGDRDKRALVAGLLGQAFVVAHAAISANRAGTEKVADELIERRELHGDEVVALLESAALQRPEIDVLDEATWPRI